MDETAGHRRSPPHARPAEAIALTAETEAFAGIAPGDAPRSTGAGAMLTDLQRVLSGRPAAEAVPLREVVATMEGDSFPVLVLLFALLLVSPLSAVPGATTLFGLSIAAILAQWLVGRDRVWLPGVLLDRRLPAGRTVAALHRLRGPVNRVERRLRQRQRWVFAAPFAQAPMTLVLAAALCAPLMEVIPASGTSVGAAIALFAAGLLARDGLVVLAGASLAAILPVSLWLVLT